MMETDEQVRCGNLDCKEIGSLRCTRCKNIKYCSSACQQSDWRFHKLLCKSFASAKPRTDPNLRRIIIIVPEWNSAEFAWKSVQPCDGSTEETAGTAASYPGQGGRPWYAVSDNTHVRAGSKSADEPHDHMPSNQLHHSIVSLYHEDEGRETRPLNRCFNRLFGDELAATPARGNLTLVASAKVGDEWFVVDIDTRDFTRTLRQYADWLKIEGQAKMEAADEQT